MTAAASLVSTLFEAVWAFEADEQKRTGLRPPTNVRITTASGCPRVIVSVGLCDDVAMDIVVDEIDRWMPGAIRKAVASFAEWRDLTDRLEASKTVVGALKRGARR